MRLSWILIILIFVGCSSQKEVVETAEPQSPHWVSQKPIEPSYYSGIGMAFKNSADFQAIAKNNALNDLSSEISVQINSSSVLYQVEQNEKFREEFKANTRMKSIENLEGFELTGTFENDKEYWVYYRLSKSEFNAIKVARKQKALDRSLDLFEKANWFKANLEYDDALKFGIRAMESIKEYLGEGLLVEWEGENIYYGNTLYSFLSETVNDIVIQPVQNSVDVIRGNGLSNADLSFFVSNSDRIPLSGIPIYYYYSGDRIKNNEALSSSDGLSSFSLGRISSMHPSEYFQANLNMVHIAKEATDDPIVSKIISRISGPEARIQINILSPSIYIKSIEKQFGELVEVSSLENAFKKEFLQAGFTIALNPEDANYFLEINSNTSKVSNNSGFYSASLNAELKLFNSDLNLIYTDQITQIKGVQLDFDKAGNDAYKNTVEEIHKRVFRELRRKVFE